MRVGEAGLGTAAEHDHVPRRVQRELLQVVDLVLLALPGDEGARD